MATTQTTTAVLTPFIPNYWDRLLGDNLRPNLYFYDLGEKRKLPSNFGVTIKIPRIRKAGTTSARDLVYKTTALSSSESEVTHPCALSSEWASGTLVKFRGAYRHGDIVVMSALSDVIQLSLEDIAYDLTLKMDTHIRNQISNTGQYMTPTSAGGFITTNAVLSSTKDSAIGRMSPKAILWSAAKLKGQNNPVFPGTRCYAGVISPLVTYDIMTQTSSTLIGWIDINKYQGSEKIWNGEVGKLFGVKFIESTNIKTSFGLAGTSAGQATSISYARNFFIAPRAYYVTELDAMAAHTFVKQLGSAGAADPTNEYATVGAKVFFTAIPAQWSSAGAAEFRIVRVMTKRSI